MKTMASRSKAEARIKVEKIVDLFGVVVLPAIFLLIHWSIFCWKYNQFGFTDEVTYANVGRDLLVEHVLRGESLYALNPDWPNVYGEFGGAFWLFGKGYGSPWFDHPILWCVILGVFALFFPRGAVWGVRLPSLIFSTSECLLIYFISRKMLGRSAALLSVLAYVSTPVIILQSLLSNLESGIRLFGLLSLFFLVRYLEDDKKICLYASAVLAGLSTLCKLTGVGTIGFLFLILLHERKVGTALRALAVALMIASVYPIYGFLINGGLFIAILSAHAAFFGGGRGLDIVVKHCFFCGGAGLEGQPWLEPFIIFSWIGLVYLLFQIRSGQFARHLGIVLVMFVLALMVNGSGNPSYPGGHTWYFSVLYPFLALAYGGAVETLLRQPNPIVSLVYMFLMLDPYLFALFQRMGFAESQFRWIVLAFGATYLAKYAYESPLTSNLCRISFALILLCTVVGSYFGFWAILAML